MAVANSNFISFFLGIVFCCDALALPVSEYNGLLSLYSQLDGSHWQSSIPGEQFRTWNVSIPRSGVCCSWDGISCKCPGFICLCTEDEDQSVTLLRLKGVGLSGSFTHLNLTMFPNLGDLVVDNNPNLIAGPIPPLTTWLHFPSLIQTISISNTSRTGIAPSFESLTRANSIILSQNNIESCPPLPPTTLVFDAAHNNITNCSYNLFYNTPKLNSIYLENNRLTEIPDLSGLFNLRLLSCSFNLLSEFPVFGNYSIVEQISLSSNRLTFALTESFFSPFSSLGEIDLADNAIVGIVPHFYNNTKLEFINLAGNQLTGLMPSFRLSNLFLLNVSSNWLQGSIQPFILPDKGFFSTVDVSCNHMQGGLPNWPFHPKTFVYDSYNGSDVSFCPKAVTAPAAATSQSSSFVMSWNSAAIGATFGAIVVTLIAMAFGYWKRNTRPRVPLSSLTEDN